MIISVLACKLGMLNPASRGCDTGGMGNVLTASQVFSVGQVWRARQLFPHACQLWATFCLLSERLRGLQAVQGM